MRIFLSAFYCAPALRLTNIDKNYTTGGLKLLQNMKTNILQLNYEYRLK